MNPIQNLDEPTFAHELAKTQPSAFELYKAHEKKLKSLRRFLIEELRRKPGQSINIVITSPVTNLEQGIDILLRSVNEDRLKRKLEPYSINY